MAFDKGVLCLSRSNAQCITILFSDPNTRMDSHTRRRVPESLLPRQFFVYVFSLPDRPSSGGHGKIDGNAPWHNASRMKLSATAPGLTEKPTAMVVAWTYMRLLGFELGDVN